MNQFNKGDALKCVNVKPLTGNSIAPMLEMDKVYKVDKTFVCKCGELHLDVGLISELNSVTCFKCRQDLPGGDVHHWAHSSRFIKNL